MSGMSGRWILNASIAIRLNHPAEDQIMARKLNKKGKKSYSCEKNISTGFKKYLSFEVEKTFSIQASDINILEIIKIID